MALIILQEDFPNKERLEGENVAASSHIRRNKVAENGFISTNG
jgi:hypothetical protein